MPGRSAVGSVKCAGQVVAEQCQEFLSYADSYNAKKFFCFFKVVYGPSKYGCTPPLYLDGTILIKNHGGLKKGWMEHFSNLHSKHSNSWSYSIEPDTGSSEYGFC